jgi:hypothetical protein
VHNLGLLPANLCRRAKLAHFDFFTRNFTVCSQILSTGGDALMELNLSLSIGVEAVLILGLSLVRSALLQVTQG